MLTAGVAPHLMEPPVNVLRLSLHPDGLAPRILNLGEWRAICSTGSPARPWSSGDPALCRTARGARGAAGSRAGPRRRSSRRARSPCRSVSASSGEELAFISTATSFGTAIEVTVSELAIESFFPADEATARFLRSLERAGVSIVHETIARRIVFGEGAVASLPPELAASGSAAAGDRRDGRRRATPSACWLRSAAADRSSACACTSRRAGRGCARQGPRARSRLPRLDRRRIGGRAREGRRADRGPPDRRRADDLRGLRADASGGYRGWPQDDRPGSRRARRASSSTTPRSPTTCPPR